MRDPDTPRVPLCSRGRSDKRESHAWEGLQIVRELPPAIDARTNGAARYNKCETCHNRSGCHANVCKNGATLCETIFVELAGDKEMIL